MRIAALAFVLSAAAAEPEFQPHSFVEVATQFDGAGNVELEYRLFRAVNSTGLSVTQDLAPEAGGLRQLMDRNRLSNTVIDPAKRTATTAEYSPGPFRPKPATCAERYQHPQGMTITVRPGADRIGNLIVDRITSQWGGHRNEWWLAPALDCVLLRDETYRDGRLTRRVEATELRLGDPDPALFEVPFDYTYTKVKPFMK